ncbi:MAG: ATP-dependent zinc metalloprotease FtsH [Candidatus Omnitrophota bacterium]
MKKEMKRKRPVLNLKGAKPPMNRSIFMWLLLIFTVILLLHNYSNQKIEHVSYNDFFQMVSDNSQQQQIKNAVKKENTIEGELSDGTKYTVNIPENDQDMIKLLRQNVVDFDVEPPHTFWMNVIFSVGPLLLFFAFFWFLIYRSAAQGGGKVLAFGKSRARLSAGKAKVTFDDVAGVDEAKEELREVIDFLKDPKKFQHIGGKIPKGILLVGHPGTGKTMLAKAVSGEAGVPFFSISGSDFVEMFVGVGASRVRDLFEQAKRTAHIGGKGAIIFIDEIDAVGRQRFSGIGGGHDEREQTLNQLLSEMDGFDTQEGVIIIAATNRPDVLDPALLRPGRFDRHIVVDRPDIKGREAILKVHARNIKLDEGVDLNTIARRTPGFSGADIANLVNEAALLAARYNKTKVAMSEMEAAIERVVAGPERKSRVISDYEKNIVAYHESGHALLSLLVKDVDPLHKVSIIPRGMAALGYTLQLPLEDRYIVTKKELIGKLIVFLGGRASEELMCNESTTGAQNDLEMTTLIARRMVCEFGMSDKLGHITFGHRKEQVFLGRDIGEERNYSDFTAQEIDKEIKIIVEDCYRKAKELLSQNKEKLQKLAETLREKEVMGEEEVRQVLGMEVNEGQDNSNKKSE